MPIFTYNQLNLSHSLGYSTHKHYLNIFLIAFEFGYLDCYDRDPLFLSLSSYSFYLLLQISIPGIHSYLSIFSSVVLSPCWAWVLCFHTCLAVCYIFHYIYLNEAILIGFLSDGVRDLYPDIFISLINDKVLNFSLDSARDEANYVLVFVKRFCHTSHFSNSDPLDYNATSRVQVSGGVVDSDQRIVARYWLAYKGFLQYCVHF